MSYGPPPEPNATAPQPDPAAPGPHPHPQQPRAGSDGHGGSPPVDPPLGFGLAVAAVIIGLFSCVLPLLPIDALTERHYVGIPSALGGLYLAVLGCTGRRRGKPLAVTGAVLSGLGLAIGVWMVIILFL